MRCPGQDMRYWSGDAAFEVPCPKCGHTVELFKDESSARCASCGHRFKNPKIDLACAQWCAFAEQCLGYAPQRDSSANLGEGALAGRLINAVKEHFHGNQPQITHSLVVFQHAKELLAKEGGDPRVVFAAALLLDLARSPAESGEGRAGARQDTSGAEKVLREIGFPEDTSRRTCDIIRACLDHQAADTVESRIVRDAHRLTDMAAEGVGGDSERLASIIRDELTTAAAKARARALFSA